MSGSIDSRSPATPPPSHDPAAPVAVEPGDTCNLQYGGVGDASSSPPGSDGFLCLGGHIGRYNASVGQGPSLALQIDLTSMPVTPPLAVQPGETWNFQAWYRDLGGTDNFTDAVSVTFN